MGPDDPQLTQRWQRGDPAAFEELVRHWQPLVVRLLGRLLPRSEEVPELCQEVFVRVYHARERYREACRDGGAVEVIVVDNASDDGTADALAQHTAEGGVLVATCEPRGAARARNLGARLANGIGRLRLAV